MAGREVGGFEASTADLFERARWFLVDEAGGQKESSHRRAFDRAALLAYNYGEAGAIDYFAKRYGLPKAISGHNQYGYWGPRGYTGEIVGGAPETSLADRRRADC